MTDLREVIAEEMEAVVEDATVKEQKTSVEVQEI